jgi:FG-GAP repeat
MQTKIRIAGICVVILIAVALLASAGSSGLGASLTVPRESEHLTPSGELQSHATASPVPLKDLTSPNPQEVGNFGNSVAIYGSTLVIGAPGEAVSGHAGAGDVYVFNDKTSQLIFTLSSPNPQTDGSFGWSVAISSSTIVVGAPGEKPYGLVDAGHAYTFNAATGALKSKLSTPNAQKDGEFGFAVGIYSTRVVVGAPYENASGVLDAGHAYTFNANTGARNSTLNSSDPQKYGAFGTSVAISSTRVVVGAPDETTDAYAQAGNIYVFNDKTPGLVAALSSPNAMAFGEFGISVAILGTTVFAGAWGENASGHIGAGNVYSFDAKTNAVILTFSSPNAQQLGEFGRSVAISGTTLVIGAPGETVSNALDAGRAYTFNATSGGLVSTLVSVNSQQYGGFGLSAAIGGTTIAFGAPYESAYGLYQAGHAYLQ